MDDAAYLKLVSRRLYLWAMQTAQPFPLTRVKDAFMQVTQIQLERALEVLVSEGKLRKLEARRLCSFEVAKYLEEFDPLRKAEKSAIKAVKSPLREVAVNIKKRPAQDAKPEKKTKAPRVASTSSACATVTLPAETLHSAEANMTGVLVDPVSAALLELCQEVMAEFDGQVSGSGDEAPVPESAFHSRAVAAGFGEESVEKVLGMWDDRCRVLRCVENGVKVLYRV